MARILITGCSTGIGRASAVELTKRGHDVIATARRPETLDDLDVVRRIRLDVDDDESVRDAVAAAGVVDVLVNNAGWEVSAPVESAPIEAVRAMFETNYFGALRMIQAVVPQMRERAAGVIVNVSSIAGRVASPFGGFYAGTKFALEALSEAMHYELRHFGIRTALIEPGVIETSFGSNIRHFAKDVAPYDALDAQWSGATDRLRTGEAPGGELVAATIADAIDTPSTPLRNPVGEDAQLIVSVRASLDDAAFEATMRDTLGLTW
ncbi:MAG: short-chain dehydrogenase/reductase [Actinomycetia bacterium]|jgi:NADP-dependent 3-hydroxy acid dehydrogenase YdfG|nr:short-chain dehydrogenase/reductase [Actinomycetes bacterium]